MKPKYYKIFLVISLFLAVFLRSLNFSYILNYHRLLCGYDPFYHMRRVLTIINGGNIWFDYYVNYPYGSKIGWMPLFDYSIAYLSFGNPETVGSLFPVILAALTVIVVCLIGKEMNEKVGVLSALTFSALFAHAWYSRLGFVDHHSAEVLLFTILILLLLKCKLTKDDVKSFINAKVDVSVISKVAHPVMAGIVISCLYLLWFGAPLYLGLVVLFVVANHVITKNEIITASFLVSLVVSLITLSCSLVYGIPLSNQLLTILLAIFVILLVLIGENKLRIAFMIIFTVIAYLNRELILTGINYFFANKYIKTVAEAQPFKVSDILYFSLVFPFAIIGLILLIREIRSIKSINENERDRKRYNYLIILLFWAISTLALALIQSRFIYIMSPIFSILSSYFILSFKNRYMVVALALFAIIPNVFVTAHFVSKPPDIYGDWYDTLIWINKNTPKTSFYFENKKPEYGVLSWWDYGNWIIYTAQRPAIANNFQIGIEDASKFFTATKENEAIKIIEKRRIRYIILDDKMGFDYLLEDGIFSGVAKGPGDFYDMIKFAGRKSSDYYERIGDTKFAKLKPKFYDSMYARMYLFYGSFTKTPSGYVDALKHFRLIYESNTTAFKVGDVAIKKIKVYEYVKGAKIVGNAKPNETVAVVAKVETKYNVFYYGYAVNADKNGRFELILPYSTGKNYDVIVSDYMLKIGNKTFEFRLSEDDVVNGRVLMFRQ